jgi:Mg-chelatase subunit ChlD
MTRLFLAVLALAWGGLARADQLALERAQEILNEGMETNLVVIADTSGSMRQRPAFGVWQAKIEIARSALSRFLTALPAEIHVGMIIFRGCRPEWVAKLDEVKRDDLIGRVANLQATGSTPIASSLKMAFEALKARVAKNPYGRNVILVVTDGEETCLPPSAVVEAASLATRSAVEVQSIGFDLPGEDTDLKRVSTKYYNASDAKALSEGLSSVQAELSVDGATGTAAPPGQ